MNAAARYVVLSTLEQWNDSADPDLSMLVVIVARRVVYVLSEHEVHLIRLGGRNIVLFVVQRSPTYLPSDIYFVL